MAAGSVQISLQSLGTESKHGLGFAKTVNFTKIIPTSNSRKHRCLKSNVQRIVNSSSGSDTVELQPSSEGSPLLGICTFL